MQVGDGRQNDRNPTGSRNGMGISSSDTKSWSTNTDGFGDLSTNN
jgi:hypothetical protein